MATSGTEQKAVTASLEGNAYSGKRTEVEGSTTMHLNSGLQAETFRFMDLSQELRDKVYDELWKEIRIIRVSFEGIRFFIEYRGGHRDYFMDLHYESRKLPGWLLSSHTILEEGLKQLSLHALWITGLGFVREKMSSPLITPLASKILLYGYTSFDSPEEHLNIARVLGKLDNFKTLRLWFMVPGPGSIQYRTAQWRLDLSAFEMISHGKALETLDVNFDMLHLEDNHVQYHDATYSAFAAETTRLGKSFSDGDGESSITTSYEFLIPGFRRDIWNFSFKRTA